MSRALYAAVEDLLRASDEGAPRVVGARGVGGGCIHRAELIELDDGRTLFVKSNARASPGMFESEAAGLRALDAVGVIRVPRDVRVGETGDLSFLLMEAIDEGRSRAGFSRRFGRALAQQHRAGRGESFGFDGNNFIGATPQPNPRTGDWVDFFREHRLGFQLDLARRSGLSDRTLDSLGDRLLDRLGEWIDLPEEPACLIHGDLWSGNYLVDAAGEPVLVDPAVYYAHREAELAMTRLFGGFGNGFYEAYDEAWPLPPGTGERQEIYGLYHLLNHLNLFGSGYHSRCVSTLRALVG